MQKSELFRQENAIWGSGKKRAHRWGEADSNQEKRGWEEQEVRIICAKRFRRVQQRRRGKGDATRRTADGEGQGKSRDISNGKDITQRGRPADNEEGKGPEGRCN